MSVSFNYTLEESDPEVSVSYNGPGNWLIYTMPLYTLV
jgi:hypothetical protein